MMGLDALGLPLVVLALALMAVNPLYCTIMRAKPKPTPVSAILHQVYDDPPAQPDLLTLAHQAEAALARVALNGAAKPRPGKITTD
jgi:hypothetical protein